ncbi:MAG: UvrABC system protein A [Parcubacteria group bacterium GW2011_GWA2_39_18]|nr:MAG: UvrABC system protein A [Parcubacteria group bacterium GW2011_GWA2_39_18]
MSNNDQIIIKGAKVNNLKDISLKIPKNKLVVITGLSGSGKSSLAFDTIYAEGQRRYIESLSSYARQFLGARQKPNVDSIEGLSPSIAIDQKSVLRNPRSTVGTVTEIYDYLRVLYARVGRPHCPNCGREISKQSVSQIVDRILKMPLKNKTLILAPVVRSQKGEHRHILESIEKAGFLRVRIDGSIMRIVEAPDEGLEKNKKHSIEIVVDEIDASSKSERARIADSVELALKTGRGMVIISSLKNKNFSDTLFNERLTCSHCGISINDIGPHTFSFNSPYGACPECTGLGKKLEVDPMLVLPNLNLTIAEGAIRPWASASHKVGNAGLPAGRQGWFAFLLEDISSRYDFSLNDPVKDLPKNIINLLLYGEKKIPGGEAHQHFEGVVSNLERRWKETDSEWTRQEIEKYMVIKVCPACTGKRLKPEALAVEFLDTGIDEIVALPLSVFKDFVLRLASGKLAGAQSIVKKKFKPLGVSEFKIALPLLKEMGNRAQFLIDVGLDYLTLERSSETLSGGEAQRIRLATQLGSKLSGVIYVLDEPSIGLHPKDHARLIKTLKELSALGNSVLVVEHDEQTMRASDWIVDIGPGAGEAGGKVLFSGRLKDLIKKSTPTANYLSGREEILIPKTKRSGNKKFLEIVGASGNNLKNISVKIPLGKFVAISGVSGSGKSTLINDTLVRHLEKTFYRAKTEPAKFNKISGVENIDKIVNVDQSPIGRTPRSNPATYVGIFGPIRDIFMSLKESKMRGYSAGRFSFNVKGGRCEVCEGQGVQKIEMHFLPDVYVECEECGGKRYNKGTLEIEFRGKNIAQILEMSVKEADNFFDDFAQIKSKLDTLKDVGLDYIKLGQSSTTLSGGEAQRIKLATELSRKSTGKALYVLDEPTTGLHFTDIKKLLVVLQRLVDLGNTVLVIEHNLDVLKCADWLIDLGPEGGERGGEIIAQGAPDEIVKNKKSETGKWLKNIM